MIGATLYSDQGKLFFLFFLVYCHFKFSNSNYFLKFSKGPAFGMLGAKREKASGLTAFCPQRSLTGG